MHIITTFPRANLDYLDDNIVMVNWNTEKSPGDIRRLAITQTTVKYYQLTLVGRTCKE